MAEAMTKPDEILKRAVENVLADDGFKVQTPSSRSAVEIKNLVHKSQKSALFEAAY